MASARMALAMRSCSARDKGLAFEDATAEKAGAWAIALAVERRSGLVMTPAMGPAMAPAMATCNRGAMRGAAVVGTGGGLITCEPSESISGGALSAVMHRPSAAALTFSDRKSTRLNSSHMSISYAVFCLKKK